MSDPLWFLENQEENESKSEKNNDPLNYSPDKDLGKDDWITDKLINISDPKSGLVSQDSSVKEIEVKTDSAIVQSQNTITDLLKDEDSLTNALQNSLLESMQKGHNPEIQITVNSGTQNPTEMGKVDSNQNLADLTQTDLSKIVITLNKKENGQVVGEEKKFVIDSSTNAQINDEVETSDYIKPKIYVILPSNKSIQSNGNHTAGDTTVNGQYCEEVGSTVINLNDLLSSQDKIVSANGNINANIDLSSLVNGTEGLPKMEMVVKIKDDRVNNEQTLPVQETSPTKSYTSEEIDRLRELLKNSATLESLGPSLRSGKEERNIPITLTHNTTNTSTWQTSKHSSLNSSDPSVDWTDKTVDSFVRDDGARCTRTVWNSPQGQRVETKCYSDETYSPHSRRFKKSRRYDHFHGNIWRELDDEIDRFFSYARRNFYF